MAGSEPEIDILMAQKLSVIELARVRWRIGMGKLAMGQDLVPIRKRSTGAFSCYQEPSWTIVDGLNKRRKPVRQTEHVSLRFAGH